MRGCTGRHSGPELSSAVADLQAPIDALLALADHVIE
jgi:hypothetical protein